MLWWRFNMSNIIMPNSKWVYDLFCCILIWFGWPVCYDCAYQKPSATHYVADPIDQLMQVEHFRSKISNVENCFNIRFVVYSNIGLCLYWKQAKHGMFVYYIDDTIWQIGLDKYNDIYICKNKFHFIWLYSFTDIFSI